MSTSQSSKLSIASIWRLCLKNWYWFLLSVVCCCGVAVAYIFIHKPQYQLNANILIAKGSDDISSMIPDMGAFSGMLGIKNSVDDELLILQSRTLMSEVVKDMGLNRTHIERHGIFNMLKDFKYKDYALDVTPADPAVLDTLGVSLKFVVKVNDKGAAQAECVFRRRTIGEARSSSLPMTVATRFGDFIVSRTPDAPKGKSLCYNIYVMGNNIAAEAILNDLTIDMASKKSNIINIGMRHFDVVYGTDLINRLMDSYNERGLDDKNLRAEKTIEFVGKRIDAVAGSLSNIEDSLKIYMDNEGIVSLTSDMKYQLEKKGMIDASLLEAETNLEVTRMIEDFLSDPANANSLMPANSAVAPEVTQAYNDQILYRMRLEREAQGDNAALRAQNEAITATRQSILESVRKARQANSIAVNDIKTQQRQNDASISKFPEQSRVIIDLYRDREIKEKILAVLIQQREQAAMQIANAIPKGTIIDETYSNSTPLDMSSKMLLALALLFGLAIPPAIYYLRSMMRNTVDNEADVASRTELSVDATIPFQPAAHGLVVGADMASNADTEPFRQLRSRVLSTLSSAIGNIVTVTAATDNVGTSFVALNLASAMALAGKRTLIMDLNLREPSLARTLKMATAPGVTDAINSPDPMRMVQPVGGEPRLSLMSAGTPTLHPGEVIASPDFAAMIDRLKADFDCIVCDTAPVGDFSDTLSLASVSAATLFVAAAAHTRLDDLTQADDLADSHGFKNVAVVINTTSRQRKA